MSSENALVRVAEADAESVVTGIGDSSRRSGRRDEEEVILSSFCSKGSARAGGYRAEGGLHTCFIKQIVTGSCIGSGSFIVFHIKLEVNTV